MNEPVPAKYDFIFPIEKVLNCAGVVPGDSVFTHERDMCTRRRTAKLIQQIGIGVRCTQVVMNSAIIMMHRLFVYWPSHKLPLGKVAAACFFLAAKCEDCPRRLNYVVQQYFRFERLVTDLRQLTREEMTQVSEDIVLLESLMLPCLGFRLQVVQPHQLLMRGCRDLKLPKELMQTAYYQCTNLLHLTIMVLRLRPETLAAACVQMAASWSKHELPSTPMPDGRSWFNLFDPNMTQETLKAAVEECIQEFAKVPEEEKQMVTDLVKKTPTQNQVEQMQQRQLLKRQQEKEAAAAAGTAAGGGASAATPGGGAGSSGDAGQKQQQQQLQQSRSASALTIDEYKKRRQVDGSTAPAPASASAPPAASASGSATATPAASASVPLPPASAAVAAASVLARPPHTAAPAAAIIPPVNHHHHSLQHGGQQPPSQRPQQPPPPLPRQQQQQQQPHHPGRHHGHHHVQHHQHHRQLPPSASGAAASSSAASASGAGSSGSQQPSASSKRPHHHLAPGDPSQLKKHKSSSSTHYYPPNQ